MTPRRGKNGLPQVAAGQPAATCGNLTQNPSEWGVPPSMGNPSAGSVYTIGKMTTCGGKTPVFWRVVLCRKNKLTTCGNHPQNAHFSSPLVRIQPADFSRIGTQPGRLVPVQPNETDLLFPLRTPSAFTNGKAAPRRETFGKRTASRRCPLTNPNAPRQRNGRTPSVATSGAHITEGA